MRRVDAEGDSRGVRGRNKQGGVQNKSKLRRATLEWLERRELLSTSTSTLPSPVVVVPPNLGAAVSTGDNFTATANATSPSVAVDPVNPQKLVAAWTYHDVLNPLNVGATNTVDSYVVGAFSTDGGVTWNFLQGGDSAVGQTDFSVSQANGKVAFTETTDAKVAFGRDESVYLSTSTHDDVNVAGAIDLQRFDFSGAAPVQTLTNKVVYTWDVADGGGDIALTPTLAVDNNLPTFTDTNASGQTVVQSDPFAGNVYLAWSDSDTNTAPFPIPNFDSASIRMIASSDEGTTFGHTSFVNDDANFNNGASHSGFSRNVNPSIAISQGSATVPGGQVTIVYDDYNTTNATQGKPYDTIVAQSNLVGGSAVTASGPANTPIKIATLNPVSGQPDIAAVTNIPINVDINDTQFTTLQSLDVNLAIAYPNMAELSVFLKPPAGSALATLLNQNGFFNGIELFANGVNGAGTTTGDGLAGANLGLGIGGFAGSGTVFDQTAIRSIRDTGTKAPYVGHFQPEGENALQLAQGLTAAQLNGAWTLVVTSFKNETSFTSGPTVIGSSLTFSSGNNPGLNPTTGQFSPAVTVADLTSIMESLSPNINPAVPVVPTSYTQSNSTDPTTGVRGSGITGSGVQTPAILATPSIASDNTLGAYSQHQGRLYVTYTGGYGVPANGQTDIFLVASDDGGQSWYAINPANAPTNPFIDASTGVQVNDDNAITDGFSAATPGAASGRTHFDPQVAVDQYTGAVVVSFFDARNDPSNARVATYVAVSNNGGVSFAPETYANPTNTATDAITGKVVNIGPVPDNQSPGNENRDPFGFGSSQGLAVADGMIIPVWASNQNTGAANNYVPLSIVDSIMSDAGGARIISSTMGPVGQPGDSVNTTRATDGSTIANSFVVTFDRSIDPNTFNPDGLASTGHPIGTGDVRVFYQDPYGATFTGVPTSHPTVANGTYTSASPVVTGHPGVPIVDGQITISLTGITNPGAVTITLVAPNGRSFVLPTAGLTTLSGTYSLPANVVGGTVDGQYQLLITDTAGQVGTLKSWSVQLNGLSIGLRVLTVTPVPNLSDPLNDGTLGYTTFRVTFDPTNPTNLVTTGVGTYSYVVRPTLNDRIRHLGVPTVTTGTTVTATGTPVAPTAGGAKSTITVTGFPYQDLVSNTSGNPPVIAAFPNGNVAITVTAVISGSTNVNTIGVFLVTHDGDRYRLTGGVVSNNNQTLTFTNATVSIPYTQLALNGTYIFEVSDPGTNQNVGITSVSLRLFGKVVTPVLNSAPVFENAQLPQLPVPGVALKGTTGTTTSLYLIGHPGQVIGSGTLQLSLTDTNVNDLTITLIGPGGQTFVLPKSTGTALNQTYNLPASFTGTAVDGQYQLQIVGLTGDVGQLTAWSLEMAPEGFVGPNVVSPNVPVALVPTGSVSSTLVIDTLLPGELIQSGSLTLSLTNTSMPASAAHTIGNLTVTLTGPGGQTFVIPTSGNTATTLTETIQLPAGFLTGLLSGTYTLSISDNTTGDTGSLLAWSIALAPQALNGNVMDQNADGTPGQDPETTPFTGLTPGDDYAAPNPLPIATTPTTFSGSAFPIGPYSNSSLPLIVSGPHIIQTNVTGTGGSTTGTSNNNLIANDQVGSVGVVFDRNVQISSVSNAQVLSILGPAGPIASPQTFASTGISKSFYPPSNQVGLSIPRGVGASLISNLTISNTGLTLSSLTVTLNITDPLDSSLTLTLISPTGVVVPLAANVGGVKSNFSNTTFSDTPPANGLTIPIASGTAPFGLTYQPASPLAALAGLAIDGKWQLVIVDNTAAGSTLALGRLNSWSLSVTPQIPQGPSSSLTSYLSIVNPDNSFTINHLAVQLNITDPNDSNIAAVLVAPNGQQVYLFVNLPNNVTGGGPNANFVNTTFDDSSTVNIAQGVAPYNQTYTTLSPPPAGYVTLTGLKGVPINGTWRLFLEDLSTPGTASHATLNSWSLIATPQLKIIPTETYTSTDTTPTTYVSTDTSTQVYSSSDVSFANPLTIPATVGATVSSSITFPTTGNTFNIANLQVALNIAYPHDTNLSVSLVSPTGMTIPLFAGVGGQRPNFGGNNPDYTILSDSGTVAIGAGSAPFDSGNLVNYPTAAGVAPMVIYRPASLLSVLDGTPIDGTWTLRVTNNSGLVAGTFNGWAMIVAPQAAPATSTLPVGATQPVEPIPIVPIDQTSDPLTSSITFPNTNGTYTLANLAATLTLTAPAGGNLSDLTAILISPITAQAPNGIQFTLFNAGDGTFSGAGTTATKTFTPLNPISGQNQFVNLALDGSWKLVIIDANTGRSIDTLNGWSLTTTPQPLALAQPAEPIPDTTAPNTGTSSPATALSTSITINDSVPINNLRLQLSLTSPQNSTLSAVLTGPNGVTITLFTGSNLSTSGTGANFSKVVFDNNALTTIDLGTAPYSGTFKPEGNLAVFNGILATGKWTLTISDLSPNSTGPAAVLTGWSLINTPPAQATLANSFQISFPTQQLSGTYALTVGAGILGADPSVNNPQALPNLSLGTAANPNLNAGVDILKGTSATGVVATTTTVYNETSVPVTIAKPNSSTTTSTLISQIVVPDSFLIQGVTASGLAGLTVSIDITFANDPDLTAVLISPGGTTIALFTNIGNGSNRANFTGTVFDDTVNPPSPIDFGGAPFFGHYNPETPLSNLKGQNANGVWTLEITNGLRPGESTLIAGTLNSWSLSFQKPVPTSGLGDPVADRQTVNFQIFNIAPTNPLANDTWTAVGPAGVNTTVGQTGTFAGSVGSVAVDPSDTTGNTVYVASASGGIWKTTNFLTTKAGGPTYLPLTDFGPTFSLNIGSIAVFGKNSNPDQSILFAGTGFAEATYPYHGGASGGNSPTYPSYGGNDGRGVGFLRSFDGGATFTLLDSLVNVDANGNLLPEALRKHEFVGDTTYKVVVDPTPETNGSVIVYAALGGPTGGLYQSLDSGNTWNLLSKSYINPATGQATLFNNAAATDIILDPNSKSPSTGNIDIVYAAFSGIGVFISTNQGQTLSLMNGLLGKDPLITGPGFPATAIAVGGGVTPNGPGSGRIVLAKPALTGNAAEDLLYQDWLYAAVENTNGTFNGLYVTKDRGENWTLAKLGTLATPANVTTTIATPTNDQNAESYDPTANQSPTNTDHFQNGNYALTMTIDPSNPNIVYLGGSQDFQQSGLIRVDLTNLYDAHNFVSFSNNRNDGGKLTLESTGAVSVNNPTTVFTNGALYPTTVPGPTPYLSLRHAPNSGLPGTSPFNVNSTLVVAGVAAAGFTNDGSGVTWSLFDEPLKANAGDLTGSTNLHSSIAYIDPVTGNVRLIFADDQGVFTALVNADGTLDNGIGTDASANYSRTATSRMSSSSTGRLNLPTWPPRPPGHSSMPQARGFWPPSPTRIF